MAKRTFDLIVSIFLIIVLFIPIIVVSLFVVFNTGRPVLFKQIRPGMHGKLFTMYKFRTMTNKRDNCNQLLDDNERLTEFGRWLRKSSLDELPELINVLKGDMSLVGPRPLLAEYLHFYNDTQKRRHEVKPGITGWAQVNGRNAISWDEKFKYDVYYVDNMSLKLDIKIILLTLRKVIFQVDINQSEKVTMEKFNGN